MDIYPHVLYLACLIVEAPVMLHFVAASPQMHTMYILYKYCLKICINIGCYYYYYYYYYYYVRQLSENWTFLCTSKYFILYYCDQAVKV